MSEKRKHKRFFIQNIDGKMILASEVHVINLSIGGASLEVTRRLELGRAYTLKLTSDDKTITLTGEVAWSSLKCFKKNQDGESVPHYEVGLKFTEIFNDNAFSLLQFISTHHTGDEKRLQGIRFSIETDNPMILKSSLDYQVKKISTGGMLIETDREFVRDEKYAMEIFLQEQPFKFKGRVTSCFPCKSGRFDVGIAFTELSVKNKKKLSTFITSLPDE